MRQVKDEYSNDELPGNYHQKSLMDLINDGEGMVRLTMKFSRLF